MSKFLPRNAPAIILSFFLFIETTLYSQPVVSLTPVISGLTAPIELDTAGDGTGRIFIAHKQTVLGQAAISVYDQSYNFLSTFLTIPSLHTSGEQGLLSLAFHPNYESNGLFYVYYTNADGDLELDRYQVSSDPNIADASSRVVVLIIPHPIHTNHNGGTLNFGNDGYLYFATGDGGSGGDPSNNAQNPSVLLGKMLRINVTTGSTPPYYTIPVDNPWAGVQSPVDTADAIWAFGLRNPFRWSFDHQTFDMWIGDVGEGTWEEINFKATGTTGGINYGWRCYEGNAPYNTSGCGPIGNYTFPIYQYPNPGGAAVTGGTVYRGSLYPALQGYYLAADFYSGNFYKIFPNGAGGWNVYVQNAVRTGIADFGATENGELYAVSLTAGVVYQISVSAVLPVILSQFEAKAGVRNNRLTWKTTAEDNLSRFEIEYSIDAQHYSNAGTVTATGSTGGANYVFEHDPGNNETVYYRLKMIDRDGSFNYSKTLKVSVSFSDITIWPTLVRDQMIYVLSNEPIQQVELIGINGAIVKQVNSFNQTGRISIPLNNIPAASYVVRVRCLNKTITQKIMVQ